MGSLGQAIFDGRGGKRQIITGLVAAIDSTNFSLTVALASGNLTGVRWLARYAPTVGDFVVLICDAQQGWIVMDKLSKSLTSSGGPSVGSMLLAPSTYWLNTYGSSGYVWSVDTEMRQGTVTAFQESGVYPSYATVAVWSPLIPSLIPAGATITSAKVTVTRSAPSRVFGAGGAPDTGPALVYPSLRLHAITSMPGAGSSPSWLAGYAAWKPGQLALGESGTWALPSSWLTAILAGTAKGIGVSNESPWTDYARWVAPSPSLTLTYTL